MTDNEVLFNFRLREAEETLAEAEKMLRQDFSPRSVVNRAYYAMFYGLLALFLKTDQDIRTSKHSGVITQFDREFIKTAKIEKRFSAMLHDAFDLRQEGDYKDLIQISREKAERSVTFAREFLGELKRYISTVSK